MRVKINNMKFPFGNFVNNGNFLLLAYTFGTLLSNLPGARFVVEGLFIGICFLLIGFYQSFLILFISISYALFMSISDGIASLSLSYYILLALVVSQNIKFKAPSPNIIYLCFGVSIYFLIQHFNQSALRPSGLFNSPLAASYFVACCILLLVTQRKFIGAGLLSPIIMLPGSRAGFLVTALVIKNFNKLSKLILICLAPVIIGIGLKLNLRAISFNSTSDSRRLNSWMKLFEQDFSSFSNIFFGMGRSNLGSLGQAIGTSKTISIESSFLGLIYSYGVLGAVILFILVLAFSFRKSIYWWIFFLICMVSVIMDSLAISVLLIMSVSLLIDNLPNNTRSSRIMLKVKN